MKRGISLFYIVLLAMIVLFTGCERRNQEKRPVVRLDHLAKLPEPLPEVRGNSLLVAVAAILSPPGTVESYQPFLRYLERKTGKNVILVQRKTYQEINDLLSRQVVDVAFVCTGAYSVGQKNMELLVIPQINGKITYHSLLIVPASSPARNIGDLRGKVFAFTDPISNTGYLCPLSLLKKLGKNPESFFARSFFTYSHDRSIAAVMEGDADGAAVDSIVYNYFKIRNRQVAAKIKIIWQSSKFGMPPVVVPHGMELAKKEILKDVFLGVQDDRDGKKALEVMGVDRFVDPAGTNLYRRNVPGLF